jgi:hypothetical protein
VADQEQRIRRRPDGVGDDVVEAIGKLSEAFEYVERARGHLYGFHQLMGHADLTIGEAADALRDAGLADDADAIERDVVGRNAIDGRWTFQIVEEFDDCYYDEVKAMVRDVERRHLDGLRHLFESEMKEERRTHGRAGHEQRPPSAWTDAVETTDDPAGPAASSG